MCRGEKYDGWPFISFGTEDVLAVRSSSLRAEQAESRVYVLCMYLLSSGLLSATQASSKLRGAERFDSAGRGLLDGSI